MSLNSGRADKRLLMVDEDGYCQFFFTSVLSMPDQKIITVRTLSQGYEKIQEKRFDAVVLNIEAFNQRELATLSEFCRLDETTPIIAISTRNEVDFALEVIRSGAYDYLVKPFNNLARVEKALTGAFQKKDQARVKTKFDKQILAAHGLLGDSPALRNILEIVAHVAPFDINVMITGKSGTGKELVARAIHSQSKRRKGAFLALNCGAIPDGLVESAFFGHKKGAFTGADDNQVGYLEKADKGTLFLDEIGEMSHRSQVILLRFLQEREFVRVGGVRLRPSNARIIASTNRDLEKEVARKHFREDLFFRLNVVHIEVPPLRDRSEDIPLLAEYFAKRFCLRHDLPLRSLSPKAFTILSQYHWPGNIRELKNMMNGLLAILPARRKVISGSDLVNYSAKLSGSFEGGWSDLKTAAGMTYEEAQAVFEKSYFKHLLKHHRGNVAQAARAAGIHAVTLHRKLKKLGLKKT
jgi:DNA-binding NtrC family response regulator